MNPRRKFVNVQHSPIGAFASFTLGCPGPKGGLGLELGGPAGEDVFVGLERNDAPDTFDALPFFGDGLDKSSDYDVEKGKVEKARRVNPTENFERVLTPATDTWVMGDLTFRVVSPLRSVPDPDLGESDELLDALLPAVLVEMEVDNRQGTRPREAFFGYGGNDRVGNMRHVEGEGFQLLGQGVSTAIATDSSDVLAAMHWSVEDALRPPVPENYRFALGGIGLFRFMVPAGEVRRVRFAVCFYRHGVTTTGLATKYLYTRWFDGIEAVAQRALARFDDLRQNALLADAVLADRMKGQSEPRRWMLAQAIRSYYGSTQLVETLDGNVFWNVNEGEYRMMNTFDLTADQVFFELEMNPWTVRNELDWYADRYSYTDTVRFPGDPTPYPGGLAFTHDMGVANALSRPGHSSYELTGLTGCFSHMTHEELVNWILCATLYVSKTGDRAWFETRKEVFEATLASMMNRDHPDPAQRDGIMSLDSDRCGGGAEITTYDSLDVSLGQARNNLYLAVKGYAAYLALADLLGSADAADQARRTAATILAAVEADGSLPAVLHEGVPARIIPAIEGLVFPHLMGLAVDPALTACLRKHHETVLVPGVCLFDDGGWKLSSTSLNSWLSKIYLCQFVAEGILGFATDLRADQAHEEWLTREENAFFAWSDQMVAGVAMGSRYYPRGVTGILWARG